MNKRLLKAFVRFDGSGRIVAGSLILRKKMPTVGKWKEIVANECCNSTTPLYPGICTTLGDAAAFALLGASTITNTGSSVVTGNLALYPGSSVVGFPPGVLHGTEYVASGIAAAAQSSAQAAYDCLGALRPDSTLGADIGGTTVTAGIYTFASTAAITGNLILDGGGNSNAVFVFIVPAAMTTASSSNVTLINSAQAGNVYWIVGTSATLGTTSHMVGNIIANASITLNTGATLTGRALALTAAVTLDSNTISTVACSINPCPTTTTTTTTLG